ncbi:GNAT family N-acetyltransferase [Niabella aurantiaca]|uniref:GNAT family N-acetyltransferase n=1 Tax=Niabella aurantiaca TaxID=379900 RepID=UPI0003661817|nr:GNAT family N-acetyltransferase [Niabella aurantiaca]
MAAASVFKNRFNPSKKAGYDVARELLDTLIRYCRRQQIHAIYLGTVDLLKAAQRFYEKNGFTRIDETALPSFFPKVPVDNVFYYRSLNN